MHETQERGLFVLEDSDQFVHGDSFTVQYQSKSRKRKRRQKKQAYNVRSDPLPSMSEEAKCVLKQLLEEMKADKNSMDMASRDEYGGSIHSIPEGHIRKAFNGSADTGGRLRRDSHPGGSYSVFTSSVSKTGSQNITDVCTSEMSDPAQFWETEMHCVTNGNTNVPKLPLIGEEDQTTPRKLLVAPVDNCVLPHSDLFEQLPSMEKTFVITPIGFDSRYETPLDYRSLELPPVEITKQAHQKCRQWLKNYT